MAVVEHGGYSAAARLLKASKSQLSRQIAELERELGLQLLFRTTRQLRLTEAGNFLYERCCKALGYIDEAHLEVMEFGREAQGFLRVLATDLFGEAYVSPIMMQMMIDYPRLSIELHIADQVGDLIAEDYDLAVRYGKLPDSSVMSAKIVDVYQVMVASPEYIRRKGMPTSIDELLDHECLVSTLKPCTEWRFHDGKEERVIAPVGRWQSNNGPALINACLAGLGIGRLPEPYVRDCICSGQLQPLLTQFKSPPEPVVVTFPPGRYMPVKTRIAIDYLRNKLPPLIEGPSARPYDIIKVDQGKSALEYLEQVNPALTPLA